METRLVCTAKGGDHLGRRTAAPSAGVPRPALPAVVGSDPPSALHSGPADRSSPDRTGPTSPADRIDNDRSECPRNRPGGTADDRPAGPGSIVAVEPFDFLADELQDTALRLEHRRHVHAQPRRHFVPAEALVREELERIPGLRLDVPPCAVQASATISASNCSLRRSIRSSRAGCLEPLQHPIVTAAGALSLAIGDEVRQGVLRHRPQPAAEAARGRT